MEKTSAVYGAYVQILKEELIQAMGCTEPIAIAYAAAVCRSVLGELPEQVLIKASGSIIKNVKSVIVPNTGHMKGIEAAAAAGIAAGDPAMSLQVISNVSEAQKQEIQHFLDTARISVEFLNDGCCFDLSVRETSANGHTAMVRIANYHTNIVHIEKDGMIIKHVDIAENQESGLTDRSVLNMHDIWDFASSCDFSELKNVLDAQISCNMKIAEEGLSKSYGANIGSVILDSYGAQTAENKAIAMAAAGSDARMDGCELPVVINSGSGNQGITCSVPVIVYARESGASDEALYRALILSNLIAIHQKTGIGRLSAFCGAVCAGAAAGAGIAYLKGGDEDVVRHTVVNALAVVSGMVCDGAKPSCAAKIAMSVQAGLLGYHMYARGQQFYGGDGIVTKGADATIRNVGRLGREGMKETNEEIINIMIGK